MGRGAGEGLPDRVALAQLPRLPDGTPLRIAGRVIAVTGDAHLLEDASGRARVRLPAILTPGRLCSIHGRWMKGALRADEVRDLGGDERVFRPASDYSRLHGTGSAPLWPLRARARLLRAVRGFFDRRDYLEVETPVAVPSPGLDLHLDAFEATGGSAARWLITSPEYQMKRLLSAGAERIYQIARCFRRDEAGALHEPEFSMLEWYCAYSGMREMLDETEALIRELACDTAPTEPARGRAQWALDLSQPFERLSVREAFQRYAGLCADDLARDEERFYRVLVEQVEPRLGRERPTFLTHYPASMASLARLAPDDPSVAERFELYVDGVELCNGFGELTCPVEQRARLEADQHKRASLGKTVYPIDERFLTALEDGMPPSAGNALGLDRLLMLVLDVPDIQSVLAFPHETL